MGSGIDAVIGDCGLYEHGRRVPGKVPFDQLADVVAKTDGFVWIGLQHPTADDIETLAAALKLPELAVEDAVLAHQRPKLDVYGHVVFAVLKPVHYVDSEAVVTVTELAVFTGPGFVVTVRHGDTGVLRQVRSEFDDASEFVHFGPAGVLYRAADLVVDGYVSAVQDVNTDVDDIEEQVFSGDDEKDHAQRIYTLKREIAEFRRAALPLVGPLQKLAEGHIPAVDKATAPYFRDVFDHLLRAVDGIEAHDRLLSDVFQASVARQGLRQSQIALRQNEDMRKISAWAAIALVPTAIAGVYGMNFDNMPELRWRYGYFGVLALMAACCFSLYRIFRRNNWL